MRAPSRSVAVALFAFVVGGLLAVRLLAVSDWDPTAFTAFGDESTTITAYAEDLLGRDVLTREFQGHDGKFFFVQANDPLLLEPEKNAEILDRPLYRSQRMLYPILAGGGGLLSAPIIVWTLIVVNVLALAAGSWAVGSIAARHGLSPWWGLAFLFNAGLLSELYLSGAGILAMALACLGALALEEDRPGLAGAAFVAAALTREAMLLFVGSLAIVWLIRRKTVPWLIAAPAGLSVLGWAVYVRLRIPSVPEIDQIQELTLLPFSGLFQALTSGRAGLADYLVIALFLWLMVWVPMRAAKSASYLTWGAAGFALLAPFLTVFVWQRSFDISRALAPLVTAVLIEYAIARRGAHNAPRRDVMSP